MNGEETLMLERENEFYTAHQAEFKEKYPEKWLVIANGSLWGIYDKVSDAAREAFQNFEPDEIILRRPADDGMVIEIGPFISVTRPGDSLKAEPESTVAVSEGDLIAFPYAH
jgi:hypothetical protein